LNENTTGHRKNNLTSKLFSLILFVYFEYFEDVRRGMHIGYWWESQKVRDHWNDQDVGGWTILKWILER
jgi:hypothetical protein